MIKVGITGNIASGKSEVENIIKKLGYKVICADYISRNLFNNDPDVRKEVYSIFKTNDRSIIAKTVFTDFALRLELEGIIHPLVKKEIEKFFSKNEGEKLVFASVPLLYEAKWESMFDKIILVCADENIRLLRIIKRDGLTKEQAQARIDAQMSEDTKKTLADYLIKNKGSLKKLENQVKKIIEALELHV